jgi:hypothetical protein
MRVILLGYALLAFKVWMVIDALRKRVHGLWYVVLLVPLGEVVYFFAVKLRDFGARALPAEETRESPSLEDLEEAVADSPSFHNRSRLGWALLDAGQAKRAVELFERALGSHRGDKHAQLGLGYALLDADEPERAASVLTALVERSFGYADYSAANALLEALERSGQDERAVELAELMARDSRKLRYQLVVARQYARVQRRGDAIDLLRTALRDFEAQPEPDRRKDGAVATEARKLLHLLEQRDGGAALPRA